MSATMDRVKEIAAKVEARTGYTVFHYVSSPTPTSHRYVVSGGRVVFTEADALAHVQGAWADVEAGHWHWWNCRDCAASFRYESDRDIHEEVNHSR